MRKDEFPIVDKMLEDSYEKGRADALNIDMDKPMHFTDEQKAWVKKYISINGERQRVDGAREFAEWLLHHSMLCDSFGQDMNDYDLMSESEIIDEVLAEWQKGQRNE